MPNSLHLTDQVLLYLRSFGSRAFCSKAVWMLLKGRWSPDIGNIYDLKSERSWFMKKREKRQDTALFVPVDPMGSAETNAA